MNHATAIISAFLMFKEYAFPVTLTEQESIPTQPQWVDINILKLLPGNTQIITDATRINQGQVNMGSYTAYTTAKTRNQVIPLFSS